MGFSTLSMGRSRFASSGIEAETVADAEPLTVLGDAPLPVARVAHLLAMKILADDPIEATRKLRQATARDPGNLPAVAALLLYQRKARLPAAQPGDSKIFSPVQL